MMKNTGPQAVQQQQSLQREVLQYLAESGPKNRDRLYTGIDGNRTAAEIERVFSDLKQLGFVENGSHGTVIPTPRGTVWLKGLEDTC